jgi:predicted GIY-YIG superfamily endonuclease
MTPGKIYLLHYTTPTSRGHQHYLGWSENPVRRLRRHQSGRGAQGTRIAVAEGAKLVMTQTWSGTPALERRIKVWSRSHRVGFAGLCPMCDRGMSLPADLHAALGVGSMKRILRASAA